MTTLVAAGGAAGTGHPPLELSAVTSLSKVLGALGSLFFVLVVNFFLFRVLPG